jgi:hypothetical protein
MHLHHELQRALADTKLGPGGPPLRKQPEDQPHAGGSRRPRRFRVLPEPFRGVRAYLDEKQQRGRRARA